MRYQAQGAGHPGELGPVTVAGKDHPFGPVVGEGPATSRRRLAAPVLGSELATRVSTVLLDR